MKQLALGLAALLLLGACGYDGPVVNLALSSDEEVIVLRVDWAGAAEFEAAEIPRAPHEEALAE